MTIATDLVALEAPLRIGFFGAVFAVMAMWEIRAPCRALAVSKPGRWAGSIGIVILNTLTSRVLFPTAAVGVASLQPPARHAADALPRKAAGSL